MKKETFAQAVRARTKLSCPECQETRLVYALLSHLTLRHGWSPQAMAAWLDKTFR